MSITEAEYEQLTDFLKKLFDKIEFLILKDIVFTKSRIMQIHDAVCEKTRADSKDVLKQEFEQVIERSLDLDIYSFLAKFMHSFMKFHPFADGNKRTAFVAVDVFLRINNKKLEIEAKSGKKTDDEKFIWQASIQQKSTDDVGKFLEKHAKHYLSSKDFDTELQKCLQENKQLLENLSE